jgi:hypothetical protein
MMHVCIVVVQIVFYIDRAVIEATVRDFLLLNIGIALEVYVAPGLFSSGLES